MPSAPRPKPISNGQFKDFMQEPLISAAEADRIEREEAMHAETNRMMRDTGGAIRQPRPYLRPLLGDI